MIYDCECPFCFFDCIRWFAGILLDTEAMKKKETFNVCIEEK